MALQQTTITDKIEIVENGIIQVRQRTDIYDDVNPSIILASNYHRDSLTPGQDLTSQEPKIAAIAEIVWTPTVVAAYQAEIAASIPTQPTTSA